MKNTRGGVGILGSKLLEKLREKSGGESTTESIESVWANKYEADKRQNGNEQEKIPPESGTYDKQPPDHSIKDRRDVVIGFDFGTASTKVVVQDTSLKRALAVPFHLPTGSVSDYLLPTRVFLSSDGIFALKGRGTSFQDLKIKLMEYAAFGDTSRKYTGAVALCAAYVGLVLRLVQNWFRSSQQEIYRNSEINWWLNLGVPSKSYDETPVKRAFLDIARTGWWLSLQKGIISEGLVQEALAYVLNKPATGSSLDQINVYPEIAAEVTGYARSDARQNGLHLMVDVGASTLDVSTFILFNNEGEDTFSFLEVDVSKKGTFFLHKYRVDHLIEQINLKFDALDLMKPIPDTCRQMLPSSDDLTSIDDDFMSESMGILNGAVVRTKAGRARDQEQFDLKSPMPLPVFLCGGGSQIGFYQRLISSAHARLKPNGYIVGEYLVRQLPMPETLHADGLASKDFHRLAVAHGLSFSILDLGHVIPPSEILDIPKDRDITHMPEMVTKDQV